MSIRIRDNTVFWLIYPEIRNSGQSPARDVKIGAVIDFGRDDPAITYNWPDISPGQTGCQEMQYQMNVRDIYFLDRESTLMRVKFTIKFSAKTVFKETIMDEIHMYLDAPMAEANRIEMMRLNLIETNAENLNNQ